MYYLFCNQLARSCNLLFLLCFLLFHGLQRLLALGFGCVFWKRVMLGVHAQHSKSQYPNPCRHCISRTFSVVRLFTVLLWLLCHKLQSKPFLGTIFAVKKRTDSSSLIIDPKIRMGIHASITIFYQFHADIYSSSSSGSSTGIQPNLKKSSRISSVTYPSPTKFSW